MKFVITTAREQHRVKDEAAMKAKHAARAKPARSDWVLHDDADPVEARINHGRWIFDCDCGSGVAADPTFSAGYCFGCGAIHTNVIFPEDRQAIEQALLARKRTENRNWNPGETVEELLADNTEHGVTS
jgi:hypothetical protein